MKFQPKSLIGILFAVGAGVAAFLGEIDSQKKDKEFEDLKNRVTNLETENKGSE